VKRIVGNVNGSNCDMSSRLAVEDFSFLERVREIEIVKGRKLQG